LIGPAAFTGPLFRFLEPVNPASFASSDFPPFAITLGLICTESENRCGYGFDGPGSLSFELIEYFIWQIEIDMKGLICFLQTQKIFYNAPLCEPR